MASREEIVADEAAVEDIRAKFGDAEAAKLSADLYKLRRNPPSSNFAGFPRWAIVLIVLWAAALETADKLPRLLLAYPAYQATLAEYQAKLFQPDMTKAQLQKAENDAKASAFSPKKAENEAKASDYAPTKAKNEAAASEWQPLATAAQGLETEGRFMSNGNLSSSYTERMSSRLGRLKP